MGKAQLLKIPQSSDSQLQYYSIAGFWSFPPIAQEHKIEIAKLMLEMIAEEVAPVESIHFDIYHSDWFNGGNSFWGRDIFSQGSQAITILGDIITKESRIHPLYHKTPFEWRTPGLLFMTTSFESDLLNGNRQDLENTLLHYLFLNFPRKTKEVEEVFDRKFGECAKELSQRDFINYLQTYRTDTGLIVATSTSGVTPQYFLGYWQSLEENIGFSAKHDPEGIARGGGNKTYYCMGPLQRLSDFSQLLGKMQVKLLEKPKKMLLEK